MIDGEVDDAGQTSYADALNAKRLSKRIAAVTNRVPKPVPVPRADGTVLLRGRRRAPPRDTPAPPPRGARPPGPPPNPGWVPIAAAMRDWVAATSSQPKISTSCCSKTW